MISVDDFRFKGRKKGVILWDIDGTLISKGREFMYSRHLNALGLPQQTVKEMDFAGLSDWDVLVNHAQLNDLPNERLIRAFQELNEIPYQENPRQLSQCIGVESILRYGIKDGWNHGVLTGNVLNAAIGKLRTVKLLEYFDLSKVFCCEFQETRIDIARRAKHHFGYGSDPVVLVGDTMNDVLAAKECDFRVILVSKTYQNIIVSEGIEPDGLLIDFSINPAAFYLELERIISK